MEALFFALEALDVAAAGTACCRRAIRGVDGDDAAAAFLARVVWGWAAVVLLRIGVETWGPFRPALATCAFLSAMETLADVFAVGVAAFGFGAGLAFGLAEAAFRRFEAVATLAEAARGRLTANVYSSHIMIHLIQIQQEAQRRYSMIPYKQLEGSYIRGVALPMCLITRWALGHIQARSSKRVRLTSTNEHLVQIIMRLWCNIYLLR